MRESYKFSVKEQKLNQGKDPQVVHHKFISLIVLVLIFGCNQSTSSKPNIDNNKLLKNEKQLKKDLELPAIDDWELRGVSINKSGKTFLGQEAMIVKITNPDGPYSFVALNNIKISYMGGNYRISLVAKNAAKGAKLGLRLQEVYPNRFDVVYDLENNSVVGTFREGEFVKNGAIKVEKLEENWCKYTLEADIKSSYFRLIFGPTGASEKQVNVWEANDKYDNGLDVLILPESLKVQELDN